MPLAKWLSCVPILSSAFHITASFDERDVLWLPQLEIRLSAEVLCNLCNDDDYVIFIFLFVFFLFFFFQGEISNSTEIVSCVLACQRGCDVRHVVLVSQPALMSATLDLLHREMTLFSFLFRVSG